MMEQKGNLLWGSPNGQCHEPATTKKKCNKCKMMGNNNELTEHMHQLNFKWEIICIYITLISAFFYVNSQKKVQRSGKWEELQSQTEKRQ